MSLLSAAKWPFEGPSSAGLLPLTARRWSLESVTRRWSKVALRGAMAVLAILVQPPLELLQAQLLSLDPLLQLLARRLKQCDYCLIASIIC